MKWRRSILLALCWRGGVQVVKRSDAERACAELKMSASVIQGVELVFTRVVDLLFCKVVQHVTRSAVSPSLESI